MAFNNTKVFIELFKAVGYMYNNDEEFRSVFDKRFEVYINSLPEKERTKLKASLITFKK